MTRRSAATPRAIFWRRKAGAARRATRWRGFHLGNGALVHEVHAGADPSPRGLAQSHGAMVNYLYDPSRIAANQEAFAGNGDVAASAAVKGLLKT